MAGLVLRQELEVMVDFHGFALQEYDDAQVPLRFPEGREELDDPPFLTAYEMRLDFESAGHTHTALLVAEVWDGEPPAEDASSWEAEAEAELRSVTGRLSIEALAGSAPDVVELGTEGRLWKVRAYCTGRAEVARLAAVSVPHGVERYLLRFWPGAPAG